MSDHDERIARFEHMADADPNNEMAHFSLGTAYLEADRPTEAAASFDRCIELNGDMTRAMELGGKALLEIGEAEKGGQLLTRGYEQAAQRGERRVQEGIASILAEAGLVVPTVEAPATAAEGNGGEFRCHHSGTLGTQMEEAPMRGPIGEWVGKHISAETWATWIGQGTKVINELRLDFSREEDQRTFEDYMIEFLGVPPEVVAAERGE